MSIPLLVIVLGPPGAGKTALAREIANRLGIPLIDKDTIKEILFDILGWSDRPWSRELGWATIEILFHITERLLQAGQSLVIECNFRPDFHTDPFADLQQRYPCQTIQVLCQASEEVLIQRFRQRAESGRRHPGHIDHITIDELTTEVLQRHLQALEIPGQVLHVDTSDFDTVDYDQIVAGIQDLQI
jgi:2-phosphoglycerate kinase